MALRQADILISNNPSAYGIVRAVEVAGHRTVSSLDALYAIADCILSDSKNNTDSDAIGQTWYVVSEGCEYKLVNWESRKSVAGWEKVNTSASTASRRCLRSQGRTWRRRSRSSGRWAARSSSEGPFHDAHRRGEGFCRAVYS